MLRILAAAIAALALIAPAAAAKGGYNKEGKWEVEALDGVCAAGIFTLRGDQFVLMGIDGEVSFLAGLKEPLKVRSTKAEFATEAWRFDFTPTYDKDGETVSFEDVLNPKALAALRLGRRVGILIDGKPIIYVELEGTGFEEALDGVIACSKGQSGFWGEGVKAADKGTGSKSASAKGDLAANDAGWTISTSKDLPELCSAAIRSEDGGLVLTGDGREFLVGVGGPGAKKRGRKGVLDLDGYKVEFRPKYDGDDYFTVSEPLNGQGVFVLRRAKALLVTVDGREQLNVSLKDAALDGLITDLTACAAGRDGWWGKGAPQR